MKRNSSPARRAPAAFISRSVEPARPYHRFAPLAAAEAMHNAVSVGLCVFHAHGRWSEAMKITRGLSGAMASVIRAVTPGSQSDAPRAGL
jgi:hypothetical protein